MANLWLNPKCDWLKTHAWNFTSQGGEDGLLMAIMGRLGWSEGQDWAVEVGAHDGVTNSNTRNLLLKGWDVVYIEKDGGLFQELCANTDDWPLAQRVHGAIAPDGEDCIDSILARVGAPERCHLLSLDIDGGEAYIWDRIAHPFRVVVCEIQHEVNTTHIVLSVGTAKGYVLIARTGFNMIFVRVDEAKVLYSR
jgi:hypothetical protein